MITNAKFVSYDTNPDDYFANEFPRGDRRYPATSSMLREFGHCPARWVRGYQSPDSASKEYGALLDCLLLTPGQFPKRYAVQPAKYTTTGMQCPQCKTVTDSKKCRECGVARVEVNVEKDWSNMSDTCAEWTKAQEAAGNVVCSQKEVDNANVAIKSIMTDEKIAAFIECSDRQVYLSFEWHDEKTGLVVPGRVMLDLVPFKDSEYCKCLGDMKSTRNAGVMAWQRDAFRMGYFIQAALYSDVYNAAFPEEDRLDFCWILQENYPPYQPARRLASRDSEGGMSVIEFGRAAYTRLLGNYCACLASNRWPGYDDTDEAAQGWSIVQVEPFMANAEAFAPKFDFSEPAPETITQEYVDLIP